MKNRNGFVSNSSSSSFIVNSDEMKKYIKTIRKKKLEKIIKNSEK